MDCPRCASSVDAAAVRCQKCGAPLQLLDDPPPSRLDRDLHLDRRTRRPASAGAIGVPPRDHATGDLSFDPPDDDGDWTFGEASAAEEVEDEPLAAAEEERAPAWEREPDSVDCGPARLDGRGLDADVPGDDGAIGEDADDAGASSAAPDRPAARRGRMLSLASMAVAAAIALVAVLTSR